ncbi:DUF1266 domain-containing protein [Litorihabitans aurantiacus]|uniref:DUF1266 domain-containing protein n=1 Tax=Litorihabitans aurantiacus TaxID=1930061 RepID=A0AA37XG62_9MICO|nr:DUF1266 domain-containing protein [Litorihabitans aurantiacus]GMA32938.1 hypothetical protein GCM10025875_29300 [Litorihabitans aurantiacus]
MRAQRAYYDVRGLGAPDDELRRVLRVAAPWVHRFGGWPLTLEVFPLADGLTPRQRRAVAILSPGTAEDHRNDLAASWGVAHRTDLLTQIDEGLATGVHSAAFAAAGRFGEPAILEQIAATTDVPLDDLVDLVNPRADGVPQLLWGWDLIRLHTILRSGVSAGYVDPATALPRLHRIADLVTTLFPTEESLVRNLLVGHAFWAGLEGRAETRSRVALAQEDLAGEWPRTLGPWPAPPAGGVELVPPMADGFATA